MPDVTLLVLLIAGRCPTRCALFAHRTARLTQARLQQVEVGGGARLRVLVTETASRKSLNIVTHVTKSSSHASRVLVRR